VKSVGWSVAGSVDLLAAQKAVMKVAMLAVWLAGLMAADWDARTAVP
jgi:hypothetical protein